MNESIWATQQEEHDRVSRQRDCEGRRRSEAGLAVGLTIMRMPRIR